MNDLLDGLYRLTFDPPDYDSCFHIPSRSGCCEIDMWFERVDGPVYRIDWTKVPKTGSASVVPSYMVEVGED